MKMGSMMGISGGFGDCSGGMFTEGRFGAFGVGGDRPRGGSGGSFGGGAGGMADGF